jgi:hypothetical protein
MTRVLVALVPARPLDDPEDPVDDLAAVLHERVARLLENEVPASWESDKRGNLELTAPASTSAAITIDPDAPHSTPCSSSTP